MKAIDGIVLGQFTGLFKAPERVVALGIDVGGGDVGELACRPVMADPLVINGRTGPFRSSILSPDVCLPEPDVVLTPQLA